mmetsp:Transcript_63956/g.106340  ORF Transcript_63956/g.106340 Transcript_63956/m.106340 type:complete len:835 (-) Transcript_63956:332-2836(-)|eukprot:CAMPEP_0119339420 /NCGR_PEP_ID=MMETSP1333-20130426/98190_1 /TAXON_ID=418940 /ORGANISM="Scyphosphaera apsteinii, Strain RCC1455" /LENGTH=834 /DNA_ID=CAMNT_0007350927 /DNA_START=127 /DNA_END=2631 /DNA_ORIENTATION=+
MDGFHISLEWHEELMLDAVHACGLLPYGSLISVTANVGVVVYFMRQQLITGDERSLLLGATLASSPMHWLYVFYWLAGKKPEEYACNDIDLPLRQFCVMGTVSYFLAFSLHQQQSASSPFSPPQATIFHALALGIAILTAILAKSFNVTHEGYQVVHIGLRILTGVVTTVSFILLGMTNRHLRNTIMDNKTFTTRRKQVARVINWILVAELVAILVEFFLPGVPHIDGDDEIKFEVGESGTGGVRCDEAHYCTHTFVFAMEDVVLAMIWVLLHRFIAKENRVHTSSVDGFKKDDDVSSVTKSTPPSPTHSISTSLRQQIVRLISHGARQTAIREDESSRGGEPHLVGRLTAFDCAKLGMYTMRTQLNYSSSTADSFSFADGECSQGPATSQSPYACATSFAFCSFAPRVFHELRQLAGISVSDYISSIEQPTTEHFSEGRSGAWLYSTYDRRFLLKTATYDEYRTLMRMLPHYHNHVELNPDTAINPIVDLVKLSMYGRHIYVIMLESVFPRPKEISERFDLKGSTVGRGGTKIRLKRSEVRKDRDLREPFHLHDADASRLYDVLLKDAEFLASQKVMDYSLLVGVNHSKFYLQHRSHPHPAAPAGIPASGRSCGPSAGSSIAECARFLHRDTGGLEAAFAVGAKYYSIGIIDWLQAYNLRKKLEYFIKRYLLCKGPGISVAPPDRYAKRFIEDMVHLRIYDPESDLHVTDVYVHTNNAEHSEQSSLRVARYSQAAQDQAAALLTSTASYEFVEDSPSGTQQSQFAAAKFSAQAPVAACQCEQDSRAHTGAQPSLELQLTGEPERAIDTLVHKCFGLLGAGRGAVKEAPMQSLL